MILIAGGTGLAPLKSIALAALRQNWFSDIYLYHGGRTKADIYDSEEFEALSRQHDRFHYRPCLSEDQSGERYGLVTDCILDDLKSCKEMSAYVCGPPLMVQAAQKALKRRRMPPRRIYKEEFSRSGT
ncbi:hypothetical protein [uncultured Tateyamaria sp.]|uniref:hypothetical protein n=1 Tax=uncultured Tateyamaria sp. TaxID=455651 RepID=UPI0026162B22|nr:hypothetical protein [uncultured Tateyamaria sp.]